MESYDQRQRNRKRAGVIIPMLMLIIILATVILGTVMTWKLTIRRMKDSLREQVSSQAATLSDKLQGKFALLNGLEMAFTQENTKNLDYVLEKLTYCVKKTDFVTVDFAYPDGTAYRNDGKKMDLSDRWYFQQCMQGTPALERLSNGKLVDEVRYGIAVPIIWNEQVIGVLIGDYDEEQFQELFEESNAGSSSFSYICDRKGSIITATSAAADSLEKRQPGIMRKGSVFEVLDRDGEDADAIRYMESRMDRNLGGEVSYRISGDARYGMFEPLGMNDWFVVTVLSNSQIQKEAMATAKISYIMLAAVLAAVIGIIIYLVWQNRRDDKKAKQEAEELRYVLEHDDLTGVLAEKAFLSQASQYLETAGAGQYCIIYLDVYKFKLINELFGYEKGDELLCVMAEALWQLAESCGGLCGRISGDKFVLLLPNRKDIIDEFYTRKVKEPRILPIEVYIHYGVYVVKNTAIPVATMIDCAQLAQKSVKGNYDNYVSYYNEQLKQKLVKEQEIINSMVQALENGEFVIYLQPQYNYKDGSVSGAEALVRWNNPKKGLIPPGDFIPIFETNGFIIKLDENVWEQACQLLRGWIDEGRKPFPISVNVSRADLLRGSVAEKLKALIDKYELTPDLLRIEITESAYMDNPQQLIMEIQRIREYGFVVEMDDFGSGYSSLNMLKDVPINVLKTDLKFLDNAGIDSRRDQILDNVIRMAHQIGLMVVAEGVETKAQADYLMNLDCQIMQGYYFSKPVPVGEFERMVYQNEKEE